MSHYKLATPKTRNLSSSTASTLRSSGSQGSENPRRFQVVSMSSTTVASIANTRREPIGAIILKAGEAANPGLPNIGHKLIDIDGRDALIDGIPIEVSPKITAGFMDASRSVTVPPLAVGIMEKRSEALLYPAIRASARLPRSPTIARIPVRASRTNLSTKSLPSLPSRPLSDGPMGHEYVPVAARPRRLEPFGSIERFSPVRDRFSVTSFFGTICDSDKVANARMAEPVFTYTPDAEHAITHAKKEKWYFKAANRIKKMFKHKNRQWPASRC